jgi:fatty-acyl-CoA synthase
MYVVDWLRKQARHRPDKLAMVDIASGRRVTYRQFDERASRFAEVIREQWKLAPGERVAVLASNSSDYFELLFGCAKAGVLMVCLNWRLPAAELAPILEDCAPSAFVCSEEFLATAEALLGSGARAGVDTLAVSAAPAGAAPATAPARAWPRLVIGRAAPGWPSWDATLAAASGRPVEMPCRPMDEAWYLLYTSGTTGRPKGVIQTYGMAFFNAVNVMLASRLSDADTLLSVLPYFHTGGLNLHAIPIFHAGGTVVVMKQFDPALALDWLGSGVSMFFGVPAIYLFLSQHPRFEQTDLSKVRHWGAGGSPMPRAQIEAWARRGVTLCFGYGMTETGPTVFLPDEAQARAKPGCMGKPVGSMLTRVVDPQGRDCGPNERGELLVKGPGVTPGYWHLPEVTANTLRDGWLHTGDVAYFDDDGDYWIVDRVKDMFISGGENVYPAEVENVLYQMAEVAEATVIGVPDEKWVEVGMAVLVARPGARLEPEAVRDWCRARLAAYKVPKHVRFVDALPRTPAGKVEKPRLKAAFADGSALPAR